MFGRVVGQQVGVGQPLRQQVDGEEPGHAGDPRQRRPAATTRLSLSSRRPPAGATGGAGGAGGGARAGPRSAPTTAPRGGRRARGLRGGGGPIRGPRGLGRGRGGRDADDDGGRVEQRGRRAGLGDAASVRPGRGSPMVRTDVPPIRPVSDPSAAAVIELCGPPRPRPRSATSPGTSDQCGRGAPDPDPSRRGPPGRSPARASARAGRRRHRPPPGPCAGPPSRRRSRRPRRRRPRRRPRPCRRSTARWRG